MTPTTLSRAPLMLAVLLPALLLPGIVAAQVDPATSIIDRIHQEAPLLGYRGAEPSARSAPERRSRAASPVSGTGRIDQAISRSVGLVHYEDAFIQCVVKGAVGYSALTTEPANIVAQAAAGGCEEQRDHLVRSYKLAYWAAANASVTRLDDPQFQTFADNRFSQVETRIVKVLTARVVHMRANAAVGARGIIVERIAGPTGRQGEQSIEMRVIRFAEGMSWR